VSPDLLRLALELILAFGLVVTVVGLGFLVFRALR
jgi:hypothetical protein